MSTHGTFSFQKIERNSPEKQQFITKMNALNVRQAFSNQNGQCVIVDISEMSVQFLENFTKAIRDVLTLACSVRGGVRIPAFALSVLTKGITQLYEFDVIRGNFNKITSALNALSAYCQRNEDIKTQEYKDSLYLAIDSTLCTYLAKQGKSDWINNIEQIELTFVTTKNCQTVRSHIESFIQDMEVSKILRITVIELKYSECEIVNIENRSEFIQTLIMNGSTHIQLQKHFKHWLLDQCTDIDAILHLPTRDPFPLTIKCDIVECMINPLSLPFGHRVYLQMDCLSVQLTGMSVSKTATQNVPVYEFNIVSRVSADTVCETSLFGLPLCLRPSQSWRLSMDEDQANQEYFNALCQQLTNSNELLLAQLKSHFQTDQFSPYFALAPGDSCLLMKCFASSDISLPWKSENVSTTSSSENTLRIFSSLQNLELIENLDPNNYESGLFLALAANLKHATRRDTSLDLDNTPSTYKRCRRNNK